MLKNLWLKVRRKGRREGERKEEHYVNQINHNYGLVPSCTSKTRRQRAWSTRREGLGQIHTVSYWKSKDHFRMQGSFFPSSILAWFVQIQIFSQIHTEILMFLQSLAVALLVCFPQFSSLVEKFPDKLQLHSQCCSGPSSKSLNLGGKLEKVKHWCFMEDLRVGVSAVETFTPCWA